MSLVTNEIKLNTIFSHKYIMYIPNRQKIAPNLRQFSLKMHTKPSINLKLPLTD